MAKLNPSSFYLTPEEFDTLQELAAFCGYVQTRGAGAKMKAPSVSVLVRALAQLPREEWPTLKQLLEKVNTS